MTSLEALQTINIRDSSCFKCGNQKVCHIIDIKGDWDTNDKKYLYIISCIKKDITSKDINELVIKKGNNQLNDIIQIKEGRVKMGICSECHTGELKIEVTRTRFNGNTYRLLRKVCI